MDEKEKKLRTLIIVTIVIAVLLTAGMVAAWAMVLVRPLTEELDTTTKNLSTLKADADKLSGAKQALEDARIKEKHLNLQLAFFRNRYRAFDFGTWDPAKNDPRNPAQIAIWRKWMHEWSYDYGPRLWGEIYGAANASGVTISKLDEIKTEAPPKGPENIYIPPNGFFKPTGGALNITITGTLDQIMTFMRRIHEGQILMKVGGGLKLEGASPRVSTSFTIQPYLVARGEKVELTAAAGAAAGAAAAPAGGAPGGEGSTPPPSEGSTPPATSGP